VFANLATGIRNTNQLHVFFVNASSQLVAYFATGTSTTFTGPVVIANNFAPPGAPLATGRQSTTQLDVFAIGSNGALKVAYAVDGGAWQAPVDLTSSGAALAWTLATRSGGGVATGRQGSNQLDAFFIGTNGIIQAMDVTGLGFWFGPTNLHGSAAFATGSQLSTANHGSGGNTLDVFAKATNSTIKHLRVVGTGAWTGPTTVTNVASQTVDSSFTAAAGRGTSFLDMFAIGSSGFWSATSTNGGSYAAFSKTP
jgi:hypothetical protein